MSNLDFEGVNQVYLEVQKHNVFLTAFGVPKEVAHAGNRVLSILEYL